MTFAWDAGRMGEAPAEARAAIEAVAAALDLALARAGADAVTHKDARDIVTADDVLIEDRIRAELGAAVGLESDSLLAAADEELHAELLALR